MYFDDEVDCEECANYEDWSTCDDCIHNEDRYDRFVQANPEILAEMAKKQISEFIARIPKEEISIELSPDFMDRFMLAWKFAMKANEGNDRFFCVYCDQDSLMASDSRRLVKIEADCPKEFVTRHLVFDDIENKLYLRTANFQSALSNGQAQELLNTPKRYEVKAFKDSMPFKDVEPDKDAEERDHKVIIDDIVKFKKSYIDDALECIPDDEEITVKYGGKIDHAVIYAKGFKYLVMPIRY